MSAMCGEIEFYKGDNEMSEDFCYKIQAECDCECAHCFVRLENESKACAGCIVSEVRKMVDDCLECEKEEEDDE